MIRATDELDPDPRFPDCDPIALISGPSFNHNKIGLENTNQRFKYFIHSMKSPHTGTRFSTIVE